MKTFSANPQVSYATVDRRDLEDALIQIKETSLVEGYRCAACDARHYGGELEIVHSRDCRYMRVTNQLMNALGIAAQLRRLTDGSWTACFYDGTERRIGTASSVSTTLVPSVQAVDLETGKGSSKT